MPFGSIRGSDVEVPDGKPVDVKIVELGFVDAQLLYREGCDCQCPDGHSSNRKGADCQRSEGRCTERDAFRFGRGGKLIVRHERIVCLVLQWRGYPAPRGDCLEVDPLLRRLVLRGWPGRWSARGGA